jgi:5-methylcytosine-specific restriction endonuclease McrA
MEHTRTLLLSSWYFPLKILRWEDAVVALYMGKADVVAEYEDSVSSPSVTMKMPAVIRLRRNVENRKKAVKFSRVNVYTRDKYCCAYCNQRFPASKLTYDHVIPRSRGGRTEWTNIVTSCYACNARKDDMTPEESGMFPRVRPHRPHSLPLTPPKLDAERVPAEWVPYVLDLG